MILHSLWLALAILISFAASARAGVDYRCLNQCVANGMRSDRCLTQCSYKEEPQPPTLSAVSRHRVLTALTPTDAGILIADDTISPKPSAPPPPEKDYACFVPCVNSRTAYALCEQRCAKEPVRR